MAGMGRWVPEELQPLGSTTTNCRDQGLGSNWLWVTTADVTRMSLKETEMSGLAMWTTTLSQKAFFPSSREASGYVVPITVST